jgi:hypothetical protein
MLTTKTVLPEEMASLPAVQGHVTSIDPDIFVALRARTKAHQTTLNAPLMIAFFAAVLDAAREQQEQEQKKAEGTATTAGAALTDPCHIRSVCAVDLRGILGLADNYMNNSASVVQAAATFGSEINLWDAAMESQIQMMDAISSGEGFRLSDITKRGAFAEMGPIFAIPCLWSNVGRLGAKEGDVSRAEVMITGMKYVVFFLLSFLLFYIFSRCFLYHISHVVYSIFIVYFYFFK